MTKPLPMPAELRWELHNLLPDYPTVKIIPRDSIEHPSSAWCAHHYEIIAFYVNMGQNLAALESAIAALPGVYMTTFINVENDGITNKEWPVRYKSTCSLRPQVRALMRASGEQTD